MAEFMKTFRGKSMAETLARVKQHFGRDAVILTTKTVPKGHWLGLAGQPYVEITAARDMSALPASLRPGSVPTRSVRGARAEGAAGPVRISPPTTQPPPGSPDLAAEVGVLKAMVGELVRDSRRAQAPSIPAELFEFHRRLIERNVAVELADQLVGDVRRHLGDAGLKDAAAARTRLAQSLAAMVPTSGPIRIPNGRTPFLVALVGPTGVGKTTTVAKLAANACLRENRRVGLVTLDTYRIAAVEQLRTYAQIIDVPLAVVALPSEFNDAIHSMADRELILIDTAGRSQRDDSRISDLTDFFAVARPNEVHLVLSAATEQRVLDQAFDRFAQVGFDRVIFTKLDEAVGFGVVLNCLDRVKTQLSYLTTGQGVPDDIQIGRGESLADLILSEQHDVGRVTGTRPAVARAARP